MDLTAESAPEHLSPVHCEQSGHWTEQAKVSHQVRHNHHPTERKIICVQHMSHRFVQCLPYSFQILVTKVTKTVEGETPDKSHRAAQCVSALGHLSSPWTSL